MQTLTELTCVFQVSSQDTVHGFLFTWLSFPELTFLILPRDDLSLPPTFWLLLPRSFPFLGWRNSPVFSPGSFIVSASTTDLLSTLH